jgi:hypothetical protein
MNGLRNTSGKQPHSKQPRKFEYPGINLANENKDHCNENYNAVKKELEEDTQDRLLIFMDWPN